VRPVGGRLNVTVIKADCFEKLVRPAAAHAVLKELDRRGLLLTDPHGNLKQQVLIPALTDKRARYVCIKGLAGKSTSKA